MPDIGKAYIQIVPKAEGISQKIQGEIGGANVGKAAGESIGGSLVSTLKGVIAAAGIGAAIKSTLDAGGALQQSFGGLETLYGDAAEGAKKYAYEAQRAGISANNYAEQAVSFGASLKAAYSGDTTQAMEAANTAILDMADNAAKMGTPLESIQNAYQGFAKQNYTMLDNLKLGYGGTKAEMQRLLEDATKLSGVEYNMDNLGDVYDAIHVIQEDLGLTGVAADEASTTFTGSMGAMQAAAQNLMANLATGADITEPLQQLMGNTQTFIINNLAPMVGNIMSALPSLVQGIGSGIIQALNIAANNADELVNSGIEIVSQLVVAIVEALPYIAEAALNLAVAFGNALLNADWAGIGAQTMKTLRESISLASSEIMGEGGTTLQSFLAGITAKLPDVLSKGVEIITNIVNGILQNLPQIITMAGRVITDFSVFILQNLPTILAAGAQLLLNLVNGIIQNLPEIVLAAGKALLEFVSAILQALPDVLESGYQIIASLEAGLIQAIPSLIASAIEIITSLAGEFLEYDWGQLGLDILQAIANGLTAAAHILIDAVSNLINTAISGAKSAWENSTSGLKAPTPDTESTTPASVNAPLGVNAAITSAVSRSSVATDAAANAGISNNGLNYQSIYEAVKAGAEAANLAIDIDGRELTRTLKSLGVAMA